MNDAAVLTEGALDLVGRVLPASNLTFVAQAGDQKGGVRCVYKPVSGERPLWDFPEGTLAAREVAAYVVSEALGWDVVPATLLREGPLGPGMVQVWREPDPSQDPVDVVPMDATPEGYLHVLDAVDAAERPVSLVHEDSRPLRRMAVFDAVINNADRKGGHVLAMTDGHRYGVDHGVSFHEENKLRTVLWGWADEPLHPDDAAELKAFMDDLVDRTGSLRRRIEELLDPGEVVALHRRCDDLLRGGRMPVPSPHWPAIPWPAF